MIADMMLIILSLIWYIYIHQIYIYIYILLYYQNIYVQLPAVTYCSNSTRCHWAFGRQPFWGNNGLLWNAVSLFVFPCGHPCGDDDQSWSHPFTQYLCVFIYVQSSFEVCLDGQRSHIKPGQQRQSRMGTPSDLPSGPLATHTGHACFLLITNIALPLTKTPVCPQGKA